MKKVISVILSAALLCTLFSGCSFKKKVDFTSGEYFADQTVKDHYFYLLDTFISLLPEGQTYKENRLFSLLTCYEFCPDDPAKKHPDVAWPQDELIISEERSGFYLPSTLPVFYGLLMRTEEYEEKMKINNDRAAKKHGKAHALKAESVQDMANILFRFEVPLTHQSTAGAEYLPDEELYVYDELEDPFQPFYDKGWELDYVYESECYNSEGYPLPIEEAAWADHPSEEEDGPTTPGKIDVSVVPLWYAPDGTVYDIYGDEFCKLEPGQRFPSYDLMNALVYEDLITVPGKIGLGCLYIGFLIETGDEMAELSQPISQIFTGIRSHGIGGSSKGEIEVRTPDFNPETQDRLRR